MPYSRLFYHFIWSTKDRLPLITPINRASIYGAIAAKVTALQGLVYALNGPADHVHLLATVPPRLSPAQFVGAVKGNSSHLASRLTEGVIKPFAWQVEYGVLSVSESHVAVVVGYIQNQQKHHAEASLDVRLERIG